MFLRAGVFSGVFAVALLANGGALAANGSVTATSGDRFSPAAVTVNVGESVTWTNGGGNHNVVLADGGVALNSPSTSSWTLTHTFNTAGTFGYYCAIHRAVGMTGTVTVVAAPPGTPPSNGPPQNSPPTSNPPGGGGPGSPAAKKALSVSFKVNDATPLAGKRIKVSGVVRPARDGRRVLIQKRLRNGKYRTVATAKLRHSSGGKSTFSVRLKVSSTVVLRVKIAGDSERSAGLSKTRKIRVEHPSAPLPMLTGAQLRRHCLGFPGTTEQFPFRPGLSVFKVSGKVFALAPLKARPLRVSLKCEPLLAEQLRDTYAAITPGYHLNKRHWNTVEVDGSVPDRLVLDLVEDSYDLVMDGLPKRVQAELGWPAA